MKSWTSKMEMTSIFIEKMKLQELRFGVQYSDRDRQGDPSAIEVLGLMVWANAIMKLPLKCDEAM
jgi:hypothetical protein